MTGPERLHALDAAYLLAETPTQPLHIGSIGLFEAGPFHDEHGRFRLDELRAAVDDRLDALPRLRQRLQDVPFGLGRPMWVDDEHFDVANHVRAVGLPAPGTEAQLLDLCAQIQAEVLERSKPLWEMWFVTDIEGGRVALVEKMHHALVDGVAGVDVAAVLLDLERSPAATPPPTTWSPRRTGVTEVLARTAWDQATAPVRLAGRAVDLARRPTRGARQAGEVGEALATFARHGALAPSSSLNRPVGGRRQLELVRHDLEVLKETAHRAGTKVNDVVLAAVTGALRQLLAERGETTPGGNLHALVPVSLRRDSEHSDLGNRTSAMVAPLPVGEPTPERRLAAVRSAMADLKAHHEEHGTSWLLDLGDHVPMPVLAPLARNLIQHQPLVNLVITNVPGPQLPLYALGAEMLEVFPVVPLGANLTLGVAVLSYNGQINFGLHADPDACPDLERFADALSKELVELEHVGD